jgi:thymidylate synthase (FAD)
MSLSKEEQNNKIDVLDHGFVELVDYMGSDLTVVNSARVSFGKRKEVMDEKDEKLIKYLFAHEHTSPMRHPQLQFHIKCDEGTARQLYKTVVGCNFTPLSKDHGWNEISSRYTDASTFDYYVPETFRKQSKNNKQCSTNEVVDSFTKEDLEGTFFEGLAEMSRVLGEDGKPEYFTVDASEIYTTTIDIIKEAYALLVSKGTARELARNLLPLAFYTEFYWTASLQAVLNFIKLRDHEGSQYEIREYAKAMRTLVEKKFPVSLKAFEELVGD